MIRKKKPKIVKCRYGHCKHETRELPVEDAVLVGKSAYYHKDCFQEKENIEKVLTMYMERVSPDVVVAELLKTINNIIYVKGIDSNYLLFALNHYLDRGAKLNYPQGLHYVVQGKREKEAYQQMIEKKMKTEQQKVGFEIKETTEDKFEYKPHQQTGFGAILGR